ncbi:hypothetical protein [Nocardia sp. XZ_19_231]|uniref:hypothetical protein n=1 Tax=Nocardia sp. XZ_19_231 TaxID=2769252 RepID=UPI001E5968C6|nr:hypothetical protein [Nocardia sp. XZ_19_231]
MIEPNYPIYLTPPCTDSIRQHILTGELGAIATPAQGNRIDRTWPAWCADNGVFTGAYPGDDEYLRWLARLQPLADRCLFVTAPDVVGDHWQTLARSRDMLPRIRELGFPAAFVAQNYMEFDSWHPWDDIDALFLGGSTEWKLSAEAANIASVAASLGIWVHMGRVNSRRRYQYAAAIGCHSVDGTYLTYAPDANLPNVLSWSRETAAQTTLFWI